MAHHYPQCLEPPSAGLAPAKAWVGAEKMKCLTVCVWAWGGRGGDLSLSLFSFHFPKSHKHKFLFITS